MTKRAEVIVEDQIVDALPDEGVDGDKMYLRQLKEEEIKAKLEAFALELTEAKARRDRG